MWGGANQPTSYPAGYGYVPSAMVSATYTGNMSVPLKTVVGGYLRPKSGVNTMTLGSTMQMTAYVTYSDGSTGTLPDAHGNVVTAWNTTNHAVAKISSLGHATALAVGSINMEGMVGPVKLTQWTVKVGAAPVPAPVAATAASPAANVQRLRLPMFSRPLLLNLILPLAPIRSQLERRPPRLGLRRSLPDRHRPLPQLL